MTGMSLADHLLADINQRIAVEEADVQCRLDRLRQSDYEEFKAAADDEWQRFGLRIRPLLDQRDHLVKQLVIIEVCRPLPVMVIPTGSALLE